VLSTRATGWLRLALALLYLVCSHLASDRGDGLMATLAVGAIVLIALLRPLLQWRAWAWTLLAAIAAALGALASAGLALLPLLLIPCLLVAAAGYAFARTLVRGRVPLITRMVAGLDGMPASALAPDLQAYTRHLSASWALVLGLLAVMNLIVACVVVPGGVLASLGMQAPLAIDRAHAAWLGGPINLALMGAFFLAEFAIRQRRFPGRYRNLLDFFRRMGRLGPGFWRDVLH
jgi:hypothetical protein